jgi:hypothetical protein
VDVDRALQRARGGSGIGLLRCLWRPGSKTGCTRRDETG